MGREQGQIGYLRQRHQQSYVALTCWFLADSARLDDQCDRGNRAEIGIGDAFQTMVGHSIQCVQPASSMKRMA